MINLQHEWEASLEAHRVKICEYVEEHIVVANRGLYLRASIDVDKLYHECVSSYTHSIPYKTIVQWVGEWCDENHIKWKLRKWWNGWTLYFDWRGV